MADTTKRSARFNEWRTKVTDRLARSSRVFLLGVIVACGIEVLVDWNSTLFEINSLRTSAREKALGYVGILGKPAMAALSTSDRAEMERVTQGVFDDPDTAYVRICDDSGKVVYEHMRAEYEPFYSPHRDLYEHFMQRDVKGMLEDPDAYAARVAGSRYRDFAQVWTDGTARAVALVSPPKAASGAPRLVLYQDHLRDENHNRDDRTAWAIGVLHGSTGANVGAILVAFDMRRIHDAVQGKYIKGFGIIAFFVALIVVQNVLGRRDKLRLLDLETRYSGAKKALRDAIPKTVLEREGVRVTGALDQAKGPVDGMAWDVAESEGRLIVMVVDPDGDGIDAAAVGLHILKVFRQRCESGFGTIDAGVLALGAATTDIPLTRPIGVALVAVDPRSGEWEARTTAFASLRVLAANVSTPALEPAGDAPSGIVGPIQKAHGALAAGTALIMLCTGLGAIANEQDATAEDDAVARYLERAHAAGTKLSVDDAAVWARGRGPAFAENDLVIVAVARS